MAGTEYVDLDAARQERDDEAGGITGFDIKIGGNHYEFPRSMDGDAYLIWSAELIEYLRETEIPMNEWRPEMGIPLPLQSAWLNTALSPEVLAQMREDGATMEDINAAAEYLYMRYIGVPPPDMEGDGTKEDPIRSLQPSSSKPS